MSTTEIGIDSLREAALEIAPELGGLEIVEKWAGLRPFAADGLPVIGKLPDAANLFISTAHYRNGILLAPLTAKTCCRGYRGGSNLFFSSQFSGHRDFG
jgi:glycine/D-amino acid oxidase-like deaminating enzyme